MRAFPPMLEKFCYAFGAHGAPYSANILLLFHSLKRLCRLILRHPVDKLSDGRGFEQNIDRHFDIEQLLHFCGHLHAG